MIYFKRVVDNLNNLQANQISYYQDYTTTKALFPTNYYTLYQRVYNNILQYTSNNKDIYLLSPYS